MKKLMRERQPDMLPEYDFSKGVRGRYAKRYAEGSNVVVLSPDLAKIFRTSESVNEALRTLVRVGRKPSRKVSRDTLHHGSHLQSDGQGPQSGHDAGRAIGGEGVVDQGDVVAQRGRSKCVGLKGAGF